MVWPYLQLMRPPNVVTAWADVLAGYAAARLPDHRTLLWLLIATSGLYGGGVVLNDVFDAKLDALERPERPIPRGRVSVRNAALFGVTLLLIGIGAALFATPFSSVLALLIALCAILYDAWGKHRPILGPGNLGLCRGLNLLLGVSAVPDLVLERWYLALIPIVYIAAITVMSVGEVHGGTRSTGGLALGLLGIVILALLLLTGTQAFALLSVFPLLLLFMWRVFPPFWRAYQEPTPSHIRKAVKTGVLSLIILDAVIAAGYAGLLYGIIVLALLLVADQLARVFAVT
jgi:4-hydroxybenzoate polyprenyltransferase